MTTETVPSWTEVLPQPTPEGPTPEGLYDLQMLVNAPMPFMVEKDDDGKSFIVPWDVEDKDSQWRTLSREEAAIQAVEAAHDRMVQITEAMHESGLSRFVPFSLLYERLTLANKMAMEKGIRGEEDGIQDVVLNGVVVVKFVDKYLNALDTIAEEMKAQPELGFEENIADDQKEYLHGMRVARYKRLGLVDWEADPAETELEPIELKKSWRLLSDVESNMGKKLKKLPVWLFGSLGVNAHINADLVDALVEAGADENYADEFEVVQDMLDKIGRVILHEFGNFPGNKIDNTINWLTLRFVAKWRKNVFGDLARFNRDEVTTEELLDRADERAVKTGRLFMKIAKVKPIFVKTGDEIEEMRENIRAMPEAA